MRRNGGPPAADRYSPRLSAGAGAKLLERLQPRLVDALQVDDRPAQLVDRVLARDRLKRLEMKVVLLDRDRVLLQQPAVTSRSSAPSARTAATSCLSADALAKAGHAEQVVPDRAS